MNFEDNLKELNLELPPAPKAMGLYKPLNRCGQLAYVSGHGPLLPDGSLIQGRLGEDLDLEKGQAAARQVGLAIISTLQSQLGSLNSVKRVVKVLGFINGAPDFNQQSQVLNGCSQLFADVFGPEKGIGARSAVGVAALPANMAVEIEAIFEWVES